VEFDGETSPEIGNIDNLITQFGARHFEKREGAGGSEGDADNAGLLVSVDGDRRGARAGEDDGTKVGEFGSVVKIVETDLIFDQVNDERHAAIGHERSLE
jgi:hypothetical protein